MNTIAIDLGGTVIKAGLLQEHKLILSRESEVASNRGLRQTLSLIENLILNMLKDSGLSLSEISGIGFSFPGLVDSKQNLVLSTSQKYDDAIGLNLNQWSHETLKLPLFLENDARMALLGEWKHGAAKGCENMVMVTLGTGIGSAVLIEGRLLRGKHFQAGNLGGHFIVNHRGTACTCGGSGCVESEASTWRLPELLRNHNNFNQSSIKDEEILDFRALFSHAKNKDKVAMDVLDHCFSAWGAGLVSMIHAFDPEMIVLSGGIMKSSHIIIPALQEKIDLLAWTPWGKVKLVIAKFPDSAALYGCDYLVHSNIENEN